ncbi:MAG: NUDIX hydrolase [Chromatiales bacterium]|jgi:8-oxo-dGTP pyrophosphatase MutT (NUDIX family)
MHRERIKPWKKLGSEAGPDLKLFGSRFDRVENPRNGMRMEAVVIESNDWVNIVALTPAREVILVEQYRFGTGKVSLEVPAGVVDPGESPLETAKRELLEETGYSSDDWKPIGRVESNPAFMNNECHFWLATDAVKSNGQSLDEGEDIATLELTREELGAAIERGEMRNALSLLAIARVFDMRNGDWR